MLMKLTAGQIDEHLKNCHTLRGQLLEVSPSDPISELIAKNMMSLYNSGTLYAGMTQKL